MKLFNSRKWFFEFLNLLPIISMVTNQDGQKRKKNMDLDYMYHLIPCYAAIIENQNTNAHKWWKLRNFTIHKIVC